MSAEIIPFLPRQRGRQRDGATAPFRSPARADDLVIDHADIAPCEYSPWRDAHHADDEPA